jgi:hypothetical protein
VGARQILFSHTANNIKEQLKTIMEDVKLKCDQIKNVSTDGGANIVRAVKDLFVDNRHVSCLCHFLNLLVGNSIRSKAPLYAAISKVKTIVTFFKHSAKSTDELKDEQHKVAFRKIPAVLIQTVDTRWNTELLYVRRFLLLRNFVKIVLDRRNAGNKNPDQNNGPVFLTDDEILLLQDFVSLYEPFESLSKVFSGEKYVTSSLVIPLLQECTVLICNTNVSHSVASELKSYLVMKLSNQLENIQRIDQFAKATILDPRLKQEPFTSPASSSKHVQELSDMVKKIQAPSLVQSNVCPNLSDLDIKIRDFVRRKRKAPNQLPQNTAMEKELTDYLRQETIGPEENPLLYWEQKKDVFPRLYSIACTYLLTMASSTSSERIVSSVNLIAEDKRSSLTSENIESLVFLRSLDTEIWKSILVNFAFFSNTIKVDYSKF